MEKENTKFKSGAEWTGNAHGREKGSKNKLTEDFLKELHNDFKENGKVAIEQVRELNPAAYIKTIASLVDKDIHIDKQTTITVQARAVSALAELYKNAGIDTTDRVAEDTRTNRPILPN